MTDVPDPDDLSLPDSATSPDLGGAPRIEADLGLFRVEVEGGDGDSLDDVLDVFRETYARSIVDARDMHDELENDADTERGSYQ